jgi:hypothetical protein
MGTGTLPSVKFVIFTETLLESYCLYHSLLFLFAFLFHYYFILFIIILYLPVGWTMVLLVTYCT